YEQPVDPNRPRTVLGVLEEIANGYLHGTPNGIRVDPESALVWSPAHFTWMDTNYPAATPRQGYPVEIQVLWIRLLRQLARLRGGDNRWAELASRAEQAFHNCFWIEELGYLSDLIIAPNRESPSLPPGERVGVRGHSLSGAD